MSNYDLRMQWTADEIDTRLKRLGTATLRYDPTKMTGVADIIERLMSVHGWVGDDFDWSFNDSEGSLTIVWLNFVPPPNPLSRIIERFRSRRWK